MSSASLPHNQRTLGNRLREFAQFLITPFSPGYNFDRYDRELRRPFPRNPQFAPESEVWRREHDIGDVAEPSTPRRYNARSDSGSRQPATIARREPL